jgi:adenylosuccinate lyase
LSSPFKLTYVSSYILHLLTTRPETWNILTSSSRIKSRLTEEIPFMATENILMKLVSLGVSRQEAHEQIRVLSHQASDIVKRGGNNNLIELIKKTEFFKPIWGGNLSILLVFLTVLGVVRNFLHLLDHVFVLLNPPKKNHANPRS